MKQIPDDNVGNSAPELPSSLRVAVQETSGEASELRAPQRTEGRT